MEEKKKGKKCEPEMGERREDNNKTPTGEKEK